MVRTEAALCRLRGGCPRSARKLLLHFREKNDIISPIDAAHGRTGCGVLIRIERKRGGNLMPIISIIVPVYKAEAVLPKCVESVLAQTFQDW